MIVARAWRIAIYSFLPSSYPSGATRNVEVSGYGLLPRFVFSITLLRRFSHSESNLYQYKSYTNVSFRSQYSTFYPTRYTLCPLLPELCHTVSSLFLSHQSSLNATHASLVRLGSSGLTISRIILGCMSYGDPGWESWILKEEESLKHIKAA
jgi:hypothetical protein